MMLIGTISLFAVVLGYPAPYRNLPAGNGATTAMSSRNVGISRAHFPPTGELAGFAQRVRMAALGLRLSSLLLLASSTVLACDCSRTSLCQGLAQAQAVFLGRSDRPVSASGTRFEDGRRSSKATVRVIERFRGVATEVDLVNMDTYAFTSCSVVLEAGVDYVFFARATAEGGLSVSRCNPPVAVPSSNLLVDILRMVRDNPEMGMVDGWASLYIPEPPGATDGSTEPRIDQMELVFEGPVTRKVPIGRDHSFSVYLVPVGQYRFRIANSGYTARGGGQQLSNTVDIPRGPFGCATLQLSILPRQ